MSEPMRGSPLRPVAVAAVAALLVAAAAPAARKIGGKELTRVTDVGSWCDKWAAPHAGASKSYEAHCRRLPVARAETECVDPPGEPEGGDADLVAGPAAMAAGAAAIAQLSAAVRRNVPRSRLSSPSRQVGGRRSSSPHHRRPADGFTCLRT